MVTLPQRAPGRAAGHAAGRGFTLIEMLVVLAIVALLASLALPRYMNSLETAREATLKHNLRVVRDAIDKHFADRDEYPPDLEALVQRGYFHRLPMDPVTERDSTWLAVPSSIVEKPGMADVRSGAEGRASDGQAYGDL